MKQAWPLVRLGDVLLRHKDGLDIEEDEEYTRLTIRMNGQGVRVRDKVCGRQIGTKRQFRVKAGQFLLSKIDARNGAFGLVPNDCDEAIVTGNFWAFDISSDRVVPKFIELLTKTTLFVDYSIKASSGTTNRLYLQEEKFEEQQIELPPIDEQEKIVIRIDAVQRKLQAVNKLRSSIEMELRSLFLSLHNASGTKCKLGDLIDLHEDAVKIQPSEAYPQVGVRGFGGGLFSKNAVVGTQTTYKIFNRLYEGAVVMSQVKGWEGAIAVCPKALSGMYVSPEYRTFRCKPNLVSPTYMQEVVRSEWFWKYLQAATRGVGARRERVRPEKFLAIELHMPSFETQKAIVAILNSLEDARKIRTEIQPIIDAVTPSILEKELAQLRAKEE